MKLRHIASKNIRLYRGKQAMSQADLAEKCRVEQAYISKLEREPQNLTLDQLEMIAGALGVPVLSLLLTERERVKIESHNRELLRDQINQLVATLQSFKEELE